MSGGFAIAAGHEATAEAGAEVLRAGGTAVDAAIAAALTAMVTEPVLAGLLGGGFMLVRSPRGETRVLDAFVQTPRVKRPLSEIAISEITADFGTTTQDFRIGAGTVAVPGLAPALAEAHDRHGRIPFAELCAPAIRHARAGIAVTAYQARLAEIISPILVATESSRAINCVDGKTLGAGSTYRNPAFADVLEVFAHEGARFVQEGEVAAALLAVTEEGGHLTRTDLARHRAVWRKPLEIARGGARVAMNPPPALGGALIGFGLALAPRKPDPATIARVFAATLRARVEAALEDDPVAGALALAAPALLERYRREIAGRTAALRGTTQISAVDGTGLGVSLTLSNGEGAGMILPGTGIMPNNMLGEDDLVPGDPLAWTPDRRLASMMTPMAVEWPGGRAALLGSGGSNRIRTALAQVLFHLIDGEARLEAAIEAPRLHVEAGRPPAVDFELAGLAERDREAILADWPEARGWPEHSMFYGGVHAVMRDAKGNVDAAGDPRRAGTAITG